MSGPGERDEIAAVLADHLWHHTATTHCACGFRTPLAQLAVEGYVQHVAGEVADLLAERDRRTAAKTLREAADQLSAMAQQFLEVTRLMGFPFNAERRAKHAGYIEAQSAVRARICQYEEPQ